MDEKIEIVIARRGDDYHASLNSDSRIWGCGHSVHAAIGDLVRSHMDVFGIKITLDESMNRNRYQPHKV